MWVALLVALAAASITALLLSLRLRARNRALAQLQRERSLLAAERIAAHQTANTFEQQRPTGHAGGSRHRRPQEATARLRLLLLRRERGLQRRKPEHQLQELVLEQEDAEDEEDAGQIHHQRGAEGWDPEEGEIDHWVF